MPRKLAASVSITDPETGMVCSFVAGQVPPAWAAEQITNPAAWGEGDDERSVVVYESELDELAEKAIAKKRGEYDTAMAGLREQLEHAQSKIDSLTVERDDAVAERDQLRADLTNAGVAASPNEPAGAKPLDQWSKDEITAKIDELRATGATIDVEPPGNKPELYEALRKHLDG